MPVHLGGNPAHLDAILEVGRKHKLPVVEDACQAHLAEWRGRKVGTWGTAGCFSFQASKNLNCGEGGSHPPTNDEQLLERCRSFQNNGRGTPGAGFQFVRNGSNHRITEFQATLLSEQLTASRKSGQDSGAERRRPHSAAARDTRHLTSEHVRWLHQECLSPLYVSL